MIKRADKYTLEEILNAITDITNNCNQETIEIVIPFLAFQMTQNIQNIKFQGETK